MRKGKKRGLGTFDSSFYTLVYTFAFVRSIGNFQLFFGCNGSGHGKMLHIIPCILVGVWARAWV